MTKKRGSAARLWGRILGGIALFALLVVMAPSCGNGDKNLRSLELPP